MVFLTTYYARDVSDLTMYLTLGSPSARPAHLSYLNKLIILSHVASICGNGGTCCLLILHEHLESSLHGFGTFGIENDILLISTQHIIISVGWTKEGISPMWYCKDQANESQPLFEHTPVYNTS